MIYPWSRENPQLLYGPYLEYLEQSQPDLRHFVVIDESYDAYNGHLLFYASVVRLNGLNVTLATSDSLLSSGEIVATCNAAVRERIALHRSTEVVDSTAWCSTVRLGDLTSPSNSEWP